MQIQALRPWLRFPGQSAFHWASLAIALAIAELVIQIVLYGRFQIPPGITVQPNYYTIGAQDPGKNLKPLALLQAQMLEKNLSGMGKYSLYAQLGLKLSISKLPASRKQVAVMSHAFYHTLGLTPIHGRFFSSNPARSGQEALITYHLWQTLGKPESLENITIQLNNKKEWKTVGVLPEGFSGFGMQAVDIWLPENLSGIGILKLGITTDMSEQLEALTLRFAKRTSFYYILGQAPNKQDYQHLNSQVSTFDLSLPPFMSDSGPVITNGILENRQALLTPGLDLFPEARKKTHRYNLLLRWLALDLIILVMLALLLFLLEQLPERMREFRLRHILGADTTALYIQIQKENLLFFFSAVPVAWGLSHMGFTLLARAEPFSMYIPERLHPPGLELLAWGAIMAIVLASALTILPIFLVRHHLTLPSSGSTATHNIRVLGFVLNSFQLTVALISLVIALLFGADLYQTSHYRGKQLDDIHLLTWSCPADSQDCHMGSLFQLDEHRLEAVMRPGARHLGLGQRLFGNTLSQIGIKVEPVLKTSEGINSLSVKTALMTRGWLQAMDIDLQAGRWPELSNEILVNSAFLLSQGLQEKQMLGRQYRRNGSKSLIYTVVGVIADLPMEDPRKAPAARFILPIENKISKPLHDEMVWIGETEADVPKQRLRDALEDQGLTGLQIKQETLADRISRILHGERQFAWLVGLTAIYTLLLSLAGIYATTRQALKLQERALGIRLAYGALPWRLIREISHHQLQALSIALLLGLFLLGLLQPSLNSWLLNLRAWLPWLLGFAATLLSVSCITAIAFAFHKLWRTEAIELLTPR